jgi:hypothetical protein
MNTNKGYHSCMDMWTLRGLMFSYLLCSVIQPLRRIQKELPPQCVCVCVSLSLTSRNCRKNTFLSNHVLWLHGIHEWWGISDLACRLCPMFQFWDWKCINVIRSTFSGKENTLTVREGVCGRNVWGSWLLSWFELYYLGCGSSLHSNKNKCNRKLG